VTHLFLSDAWFDAVEQLLAGERPELPDRLKPIYLNIDVLDGNEVIKTTYRGCWFERGHDPTARALLTTPRELCFEVMVRKNMALGLRALATRKAKLKGDQKKLMPIKATRPTPSQAAFEKKVLEMTVL
jgi:hypothetical protein